MRTHVGGPKQDERDAEGAVEEGRAQDAEGVAVVDDVACVLVLPLYDGLRANCQAHCQNADRHANCDGHCQLDQRIGLYPV